MICPKCGGTIKVNRNCSKCGISYDEMIRQISHEEMISLFKKMHKKMSEHKSITLEESLLACELHNSSLLVPIEVSDDDVAIGGIKNRRGKKFILLFTDKDEYDKCDFAMKPQTNPFREILNLLEDNDAGFVINLKSIACEIPRQFIDRFFGDDLDVE